MRLIFSLAEAGLLFCCIYVSIITVLTVVTVMFIVLTKGLKEEEMKDIYKLFDPSHYVIATCILWALFYFFTHI